MQVREYISPDGLLRFMVTCPDGDWTIGFAGFPWHIHGTILSGLSGQDEITAIEQFVADLTSNVSFVALMQKSGKLTDVWVTDDPADVMLGHQRYGAPDETFLFRRWDGTLVPL
jgi:hypothetical protein